jgi:hypothetical protein
MEDDFWFILVIDVDTIHMLEKPHCAGLLRSE